MGFNVFTDRLFTDEYLEEKRQREQEFLKSFDLSAKLKLLEEQDLIEQSIDGSTIEGKDDVKSNRFDSIKNFEMYYIQRDEKGELHPAKVDMFSEQAKEILKKKGGVDADKYKEYDLNELNDEEAEESILSEIVKPQQAITEVQQKAKVAFQEALNEIPATQLRPDGRPKGGYSRALLLKQPARQESRDNLDSDEASTQNVAKNDESQPDF